MSRNQATIPADPRVTDSPRGGWTFLTNHSHVLLCLHAKPDARIRDVAERVGITERAVQRIVQELEVAGVISRRREGRRNMYTINQHQRLRHPVEAHCSIHHLIDMVHQRD